MTAEMSNDTAKRWPLPKQDQHRMQLRRAIEDFAQERQLSRDLVENPELVTADYLIAAHSVFR